MIFFSFNNNKKKSKSVVDQQLNIIHKQKTPNEGRVFNEHLNVLNLSVNCEKYENAAIWLWQVLPCHSSVPCSI